MKTIVKSKLLLCAKIRLNNNNAVLYNITSTKPHCVNKFLDMLTLSLADSLTVSAVDYTDCTFAEGGIHLQRVSWI